MEIQRLFDKIVIRSGQFLITPSKLELNVDRFRDLVEDALAVYSKFSPYEQYINIHVTSPRTAALTKDRVVALTGKPFLGEPDFLSDVTPIRMLGTRPSVLFKNLDPMHNSELIIKAEIPWVYRKPNVTVSFAGEWEIHCCYRHRVWEQEENGTFKYSLPTIDPAIDEVFIKYVQGLFLQGIGKSRRAFTLSDLPIAMDADTIVSEGIDLVEKAVEEMEANQKFYLGY